MKLSAVGACCLVIAYAGTPAHAKGGFFPTYHPKPCEGDSCRGDDARSGVPCTGLLCSFSSAKALERPVTASEAAEMQAHAAAVAAAAPVATEAAPAKPKRKTAAKSHKAEKPAAAIDATLDADNKH